MSNGANGPEFSIGGRSLGLGNPCLIIGEVAQNHDGSLGTAHSFIDVIADAGADAVKFQTHIAAAESTVAESFRIAFSYQDATRYDYWRRMEFTEAQWLGLARHADDRGLIFLSSPFCNEAIDLLLNCGIKAWKVASGELGNTQLLDRMLSTKLPLLLSTGMTSLEEIDSVVIRAKAAGVPKAVMQCTSRYPTPPEEVGINMLYAFRERFGCPIGLSDHTGKIYSSLAAATLGANIIEVHVTLSREMFGPDVVVSLTPAELRNLVEGVRFINTMLNNPIDKDAMAQELRPMRRLFFKSVVARHALRSGTVLQSGDLMAKKPGTGIPADQLDCVVGRRLCRDVAADEVLNYGDLVETTHGDLDDN